MCKYANVIICDITVAIATPAVPKLGRIPPTPKNSGSSMIFTTTVIKSIFVNDIVSPCDCKIELYTPVTIKNTIPIVSTFIY